jgi:dienelactone hydrolase
MRTRKCIRDSVGFLLSVVFAVTLFAATTVWAYEQVQFPSLDGKTELTAYLIRPMGQGPFPAVIMLHGCGGLGYSGTASSKYSSWTKELNEMGLAVLMVDSAGSRKLGPTCGKGKERIRMYRERPRDAYGALAYLQLQDYIQPDKIGVIGWSQGGAIVLLSIVQTSISRPLPPPKYDFAAAVAFYPALCNDKIQSRPFTKVEPNTWSTRIPLLVLQGGADNWTVPEPCAKFIDAVQKRGSPVSIVVYSGAYHGFDASASKIKTLPKYKTLTGVIPIVGTDKAAREDALKRVPAFLAEYLLPGN